MVVFAVVGFISRSLPRMGVNKFGEHGAIVNIAGSSRRLDNQLRIGILDHMALITIETLVFALAAKASLGVRGAAIDVGMIIIVIWVGMFLLNPKQVDLGCHVGGIQDMQPIRNKSLGPSLLHHLVEQVPKTISPQTLPEAAQRGVVWGETPRRSVPRTT